MPSPLDSKHTGSIAPVAVAIPSGFIVESFSLKNSFSQDTLSFTPLSSSVESSTTFF